MRKPRILHRSQVQEIIDRFAELNPYDFDGSILRFLDCNYIDSEPEKGFRNELLAFCVSAKRYTTYERDGKRIIIIDPKAHGLRYLYPPADAPPLLGADHEIAMWVYEAWEWLVRRGVRLHVEPFAIVVQTPANDAYGSDDEQSAEAHALIETARPFDLFFVPVLANCGQPANVDPKRFLIVTRFEPDQSKWMDAVCFNIDDPNDTRECRLGATFDSPHFGGRPIVDTFEELLHRYFYHSESKSLGPGGEPCQPKTRGRLLRTHVIGGKRIASERKLTGSGRGATIWSNASDAHRVHA